MSVTDRIILLSGKQGSGKSTLTQELIGLFSKAHVNEFKFAETIYSIHNYARELLKKFGIEHPDHLKIKDGKMLQWLGTEWGRGTYGEDVWTKCTRGEISGFFELYSVKPKIAVISDCRFKNEFAEFPDALRVRLECSEFVRRDRCEQWRTNTTHPSEVDLDGHSADGLFDVTFYTEHVSSRNIAQLIKAQLDKNVWMEKRKAQIDLI